MDVPSILLAPSRREQRQVRLCRLAVLCSQRIFQAFGKDHDSYIGDADLEEHFGVEGALEHLSLWDHDADGRITRTEMVDVLLSMFKYSHFNHLSSSSSSSLFLTHC